jgi:hypothetical protein
MYSKTIGILAITGLGLVSCGPPSPDANSAAPLSSTWGTVADGQWLIRVASFTNVCQILQQMSEVSNSNEIEITMTAATGQTTLAPGEYPIASGTASAKFDVWDSTCNKTLKVAATSGSITLSTALGVAGVASNGSYDLQFGDGSHKAGTFTASSCNVFQQGGSGICVGGVSTGGNAGNSGVAGTSGAGGTTGSGGGSTAGNSGSGGSPNTGVACNSGPGTCTFPGGTADHCRNGAACQRPCATCNYACLVNCTKDSQCAGFCSSGIVAPLTCTLYAPTGASYCGTI